jgi:mono/diheme cytochrome c family protein
MRKILKWIGIVLGVLIGLIVLAVVVLNIVASRRLNRTYDVEAEAIAIPSDDDSLARGEYLATTLCSECHGEGLSGELMFEEAGIATVYAPNITPSEAGVGGFSDADYVNAIRHGVDPDGKGLMIMPAEVLIHWSEEDLGATIAYLKTIPPVDDFTPEKELSIAGRAMLSAGLFGDLFAAEYIDHEMPFPERPEIGANPEYGAYFTRAFVCTLCHGDDMRGGPPPPNIPEIGQVPSALAAASWSLEEFMKTVTTGVKPDGSQIDPEGMPWELFANFNEEELEAVHLYLQSLAAQ